MSDRQSIQQFLLGTAVKITTVFDVDTVDSATMTIKDPTGYKVINAQNMTRDTEKVYSYTWQSAITSVEGEYVATVTVMQDGFTTVKQDFFILVRQPFM